jgi:1-acyl-sn-glycerol-3-phosphate acyltransferase
MPREKSLIKYPRYRFKRFLVRAVGRVLLPLVCRVKIEGKENFPKSGPAILVGNHVAVMEPVLLAVYSPRQVEFVGSVDVPHEPSSKAAIDFYSMIEIFRGKPERHALKDSLAVLAQGAYLAIFPEGGLWNPGTMKPKSGAAFLSHRSGAPVVPIGMVGTHGALNAIFALKRPELRMVVGKPIPACKVSEGEDPREVYNAFSEHVMDQVYNLLPEEMLAQMYDVASETFELRVEAVTAIGEVVEIPPGQRIKHDQALALLLHRPGILKIFRANLHMPVAPIERLHETPDTSGVRAAIEPMIAYLSDEKQGNPYLLTYRFDTDNGRDMLLGLKEWLELTHWADEQRLELKLTPIRRFYSRRKGEEIVQTEQGEFDHWR